jgi:hypothetical protein
MTTTATATSSSSSSSSMFFSLQSNLVYFPLLSSCGFQSHVRRSLGFQGDDWQWYWSVIYTTCLPDYVLSHHRIL